VGLCLGRQNGKNEVLLVRELAGLFLLGEKLILHTAQLQKAADTQFRRMLDVINSIPEFKVRLARKNSSYGMQEIELKSGQRIIFTTRQGTKTGRSATVDLTVYDESMFLSEVQRSAIAPTMSALSMTGNPQTFYAGSAVDCEHPEHDGVPFTQVRQAGIEGHESVMWVEWSVEGDDPERVPEELLRDPVAWAQANPALGIRISREWVLHELEVEMSRRGFAVERLGVGAWRDLSEDAGRVIGRAAWAAIACHDESKTITGPRMFGVDINPDRTWGSIGVAGEREDGLWHMAVVDRKRDPQQWLVARCEDLSRDYAGARFVVDTRSPATNFIAHLENAGVNVIGADTTDYGQACADFFDGVMTATLRYPVPSPQLDEAVANAATRKLGDRWAWDRRSSTGGDITALVAVTLALWGAQSGSGTSKLTNMADVVRELREEGEEI
jgi:hypothetical protein